MYKPLIVLSLFLSSSTQICRADDLSNTVATICSVAAIAGTTYLASKGYTNILVYAASARFDPARHLLNYYSQFSAVWNADLDQQLKTALKRDIIHAHGKNRSRYACTVYYELWCNRSAFYVEQAFNSFPLLKYKKDLDWYIKRLRIVHFLSLYNNKDEIKLLIDQLEYVRNIIMADHDYYQEEQIYMQGTTPVVHVHI